MSNIGIRKYIRAGIATVILGNSLTLNAGPIMVNPQDQGFVDGFRASFVQDFNKSSVIPRDAFKDLGFYVEPADPHVMGSIVFNGPFTAINNIPGSQVFIPTQSPPTLCQSGCEFTMNLSGLFNLTGIPDNFLGFGFGIETFGRGNGAGYTNDIKYIAGPHASGYRVNFAPDQRTIEFLGVVFDHAYRGDNHYINFNATFAGAAALGVNLYAVYEDTGVIQPPPPGTPVSAPGSKGLVGVGLVVVAASKYGRPVVLGLLRGSFALAAGTIAAPVGITVLSAAAAIEYLNRPEVS